jgi:hypothetical protein
MALAEDETFVPQKQKHSLTPGHVWVELTATLITKPALPAAQGGSNCATWFRTPGVPRVLGG